MEHDLKDVFEGWRFGDAWPRVDVLDREFCCVGFDDVVANGDVRFGIRSEGIRDHRVQREKRPFGIL